ncbi:hypothetical protein ABE137_01835 [Brevibacillus laterosporus]|uniref:Uncharacterized protein n=2 Tax=Brevibacillus TaxID=55080 RepID=A0A0F7EF91_BRELA|nr:MULTISPECIES: hypothetical protein [Brevibacillus]AKF93017.1 hypothetical protein EX87_04520 [Brevibacillus laterosporus]MCR8986757.1 hypothetical protein [Brevibacillus laterosporus]MCZ0832493.1 hypothetical protein [Brevibacillus halotolerans]GIO01895.1 hypothetical protein J5TS2_25630 [Brevibacillus halotolerans]
MSNKAKGLPDCCLEGRDKNFMDIDRMVNEGLGGGTVAEYNGLIEETTVDSMDGEYTTNKELRGNEL